jgi:hypothetical protein
VGLPASFQPLGTEVRAWPVQGALPLSHDVTVTDTIAQIDEGKKSQVLPHCSERIPV